jgi:Short C-terminal domain
MVFHGSARRQMYLYTVLIPYLIVWLAIGAGVGLLIGRSKERPAAGFWLGLLLGWIGWIIIALMSRTPEAEARRHIAVAAASQRLAGAPGAPQPLPGPYGAQPSRRAPQTAESRRATDNVLAQIRIHANADPNGGDVHAAIDRFASEKRPQRMVSDWFFAGGAFQFLCRYDGGLFASNQQMVRTLGTRAIPPVATYTANSDGTIVTATIDGMNFEGPHPQLNAARVLESLRATRVDAPPPPAGGLPAPNHGSIPAAAPIPAPASIAAADAIRTLRTLLDDGLIDQAEYDAKRREIIDRI